MLILKILAVILGIVGLVGCILPVIPGPPLSWLGLLLAWLAVTLVVTVLDYIVPAWVTTKTGGSKAAGRGTLVGMIIGLIFFPPWGMIAGSFLGALLSEVLFAGRNVTDSIKPAFGSFLGFLLGTGLKLTASGVMLFYIIKYL